MNWLFEDPLWIVAAGTLAAGVLAVAWTQTGRAAWLGGAAAALLLTALGVALERYVVTPREEVAATLDDAARALESGDLARVLAHLAPDTEIYREAQARLPELVIGQVRTSDMLITVDESRRPPLAEARFFVRVTLGAPAGQLPYDDFVRRVRLVLRRPDGTWLIADYAFENWPGAPQG